MKNKIITFIILFISGISAVPGQMQSSAAALPLTPKGEGQPAGGVLPFRGARGVSEGGQDPAAQT